MVIHWCTQQRSGSRRIARQGSVPARSNHAELVVQQWGSLGAASARSLAPGGRSYKVDEWLEHSQHALPQYNCQTTAARRSLGVARLLYLSSSGSGRACTQQAGRRVTCATTLRRQMCRKHNANCARIGSCVYSRVASGTRISTSTRGTSNASMAARISEAYWSVVCCSRSASASYHGFWVGA